MRHPFLETADLLRQLIALERRTGGRWADESKIARWRVEVQHLERLARVDRQQTEDDPCSNA